MALLSLPLRAEPGKQPSDNPYAAESEAPTTNCNPAAKAEPANEGLTRARALFRQARALVADSNYAQGCAKFEESLKLDEGIGTQYNLADCWEKLGRTASAHQLFLRTAQAAEAADQRERAQVARSRAAALEPKLSRLQIEVEERVQGMEIHRGDDLVAQKDWDSPVAIDPGTYEIHAQAPQRKPWTTKVTVPRSPVIVSVSVPKLEIGPKRASERVAHSKARPAKEARDRDAEPASEPAQPAANGTRSSKTSRTFALIMGGVGVAALVAGATFAFQYQTSHNDAQAVCRSSVNCTAEEVALHSELVEDERSARTLMYAGFGLGAASLTAAAILFLSSGRTEKAPETTARAPSVTPLLGSSYGAAISGSFF